MVYKKYFSHFTTKSNEKQKEVAFLRLILNSTSKASLLDVGGGSGIIAKGLYDLFKNIYIIEKNYDFRSDYNGLEKVKFIHSDAEDFYTSKKFDTIIFSHCLPYIDENKRLDIINRYTRYLKKFGKLIIIETTTEGELGIIKEKVNGNKIVSTYDLLTDALIDKKINFDKYLIKSYIKTYNYLDMINVLAFFCEKYSARFEKNKIDLSNYVENNLKHNNSYHLSVNNRAIVLNNI